MTDILEKINIEDIKMKLYQNLKPSGWGDKLKSFILSDDFDKILSQLLSEAKSGKRFTPVLKQLFRFFEECPLQELKIIMVSQDPYPSGPLVYREGKDGMVREVSKFPVADGIPFSSSNTDTIPASLKYIFKALEETVYPEGYTWDPDLKRWSNQGVLLLNCALTTQLNKTGVHYELWKPFLSFLFDYFQINHSGLVYIFLGKKAKEWSNHIKDEDYRLFASHPASAAYKDLEKWDCNNIFNDCNKIIEKTFGKNSRILW